MKVLFVNEASVRNLLPMEACVPLMRGALAALSRGDVVLPLRSKMWLPDQSGLLGLMPGYLGDPRSFGLKVVAVMPGNHGTPYDSHQGVVILFGVEHGEPLAVMDASAITAIRTAAASGAATEVLARPDAGDLALIGAGVQAKSHLEAMRVVRPLRRVRVWSRSRAKAEAFAREQADGGAPIEVASTGEAAVRGADLVCTTTSAKEPVLEGAWLSPGAHVNAVGACFPSTRELDTEAVLRSRFYTDCRESCTKEAGDYLIPRNEGAIQDSHLAGEVGEVILGRVPGRTSPDQITVYESLGVAVEDLAAAHAIHQRALTTGAGLWLEWGGPP
ncbi:MAG TPA: ornithine cyclodeaminase family protein [Candidatus Eisenbacteria bacterium]|jgi:ornithine cyclodeaminase|nr:ornithine cyclodeaminase family protein [Candidatus Eisenbacteria bacterium]